MSAISHIITATNENTEQLLLIPQFLPTPFIALNFVGYHLDMIYITAIGLTPGGSSTAHIYIQTVHRIEHT
jgi:hypothetical protein